MKVAGTRGGGSLVRSPARLGLLLVPRGGVLGAAARVPQDRGDEARGGADAVERAALHLPAREPPEGAPGPVGEDQQRQEDVDEAEEPGVGVERWPGWGRRVSLASWAPGC